MLPNSRSRANIRILWFGLLSANNTRGSAVEGGGRSARRDVADSAAQEVISVLGSAASWLCNCQEITLPPFPIL